MSEVYYGSLAMCSLIGLVVTLFGPLGSIIGLSMIGLSNGLAVSLSLKKKCRKAPIVIT